MATRASTQVSRNLRNCFGVDREGKEALFEAYREESIRTLKRRHVMLSPAREKGHIRLKASFLALEWPAVNVVVNGGYVGKLESAGRNRRQAILDLRPTIEGQTFLDADEPSFVFQVLARDRGLRVFHGDTYDLSRSSGLEDYLCLMLRVDGGAKETTR